MFTKSLKSEFSVSTSLNLISQLFSTLKNTRTTKTNSLGNVQVAGGVNERSWNLTRYPQNCVTSLGIFWGV